MYKKLAKIIAVDFDGTLCENMWPGIGAENTPIIKELIQRRDDGDKLILYTCRTGNLLDAAVLWCKARGLEFDAVNENLPEMIREFGGDCRKIYADEYWDDKSVIVCAKRTGRTAMLCSGQQRDAGNRRFRVGWSRLPQAAARLLSGIRWIARIVSDHLQVKQWKEAQIELQKSGFRKWLDIWR